MERFQIRKYQRLWKYIELWLNAWRKKMTPRALRSRAKKHYGEAPGLKKGEDSRLKVSKIIKKY